MDSEGQTENHAFTQIIKDMRMTLDAERACLEFTNLIFFEMIKNANAVSD